MKNLKHTANLNYFYSEHPYPYRLDFTTNVWLICFITKYGPIHPPPTPLIHLIFSMHKCGFWPNPKFEFAQSAIHLLGLLQSLHSFPTYLKRNIDVGLKISFSPVSSLCIDTLCPRAALIKACSAALLTDCEPRLTELKVKLPPFCAVPTTQTKWGVFRGPSGLDCHECLRTSMCLLPLLPRHPPWSQINFQSCHPFCRLGMGNPQLAHRKCQAFILFTSL